MATSLFAQAQTGTGNLPLPMVSSVTASGFTVTWTTSSPLNTQVWYGRHASPPTLGTHLANWTLVTSHTATVAGLAAGVVYDVQVESSYYDNPVLVSPVFTITTTGTGTRTLQVQPSAVTLQVGHTQTFTAVYSDGSPAGSLIWSASNGGEISIGGVFTATAAGSFTVTASDGNGLTASAIVTVQTPPSSGLSIPNVSNVTATSFTLTWTTSQALNTQVHFGLPGSSQVSSYADWTLTTTHTAVIGGLQAGATYTVVAESSYFTDPDLFSPSFTVTLGAQPPPRTLGLTPANSALQVGQTQTLMASYSDGSPIGMLTWSVDNGGQISSSGVFTATAAGTFTVTANDSSGLAASATILVQAASPNGLAVPVISHITATSFTLTWQTVQALNTQVHFGLPGSNQTTNYADWTLTTTHTAVISGLQTGATYTVVAESSYFTNPDLFSPGFTVTLTPTTVSVTAPQPDMGPSQSLELTASVSNDVNAAGVTWSMGPGNPGILKPVDALHATYIAPASIGQAAVVTVMATSKADASQTATVRLTLHPVTVTISGVSSTTLAPLQAAEFSVTLSYDTNHQGVTWSILGNGQGTVGSIDSLTGVYTAPALVTAAGTATVVAISVLDPTVRSAPITISYQPPSTPYWQDLVQFENGNQRTPAKPWDLLKNGSTWQPDLLIFRDTITGSEIWRLSNGPSDTYQTSVVNRPAWSADGSWFMVGSTRNPSTQPAFVDDWVYAANGGHQRPVAPIDPSRTPSWTQPVPVGNQYLPQDRFDPNLVYAATSNDTNNGTWPEPHSYLYAMDINNGFTLKEIVELPNPTIRKEILSYLSEDDKIIVSDSNPPLPEGGVPAYIPNFYVIDVKPGSPTYGRILYQYSIAFGITQFPSILCSATGGVQPCHDPQNEYHLHDFLINRDADDEIGLNYGPRGDVGESVDFQVPLDGNPAGITVTFPHGTDPYFSHPAFNFGHTEVVYDGEDDTVKADYGVWLRDLTTGSIIREIGATPFQSGHCDWSGYDQNYFVFDAYKNYDPPSFIPDNFNLYEGLNSATDNFASTGKPYRMLFHYPDRDPGNTVPLLYSPTQSPDATKVMVTIPDSFYPADNAHLTTYVVVSHPPFPPTLTVSSTLPVTLSWAPYATAREVAGYHVYRSDSASASAFHEISSGLVQGTTYTDSTAAAGHTYLYAVTAEEHSGLESNQLSNVVQVTVGGGSVPFAPAGTTGWDATAPDPVTQPAVCSLGTNGDGAVVWKVTWTPSDSADVRYDNVYVSLGNPPQAAQPYLVDSPPLGSNAYIYWQGDPEIAPQFGITAVDRQGNESTLTIINAAGQTNCP